jgi:putative transposase
MMLAVNLLLFTPKLNFDNALACDDPNEYNRPISQWTNRELAAEMVEQKIVIEISPRHVGRLLAEAELKPHQSGYWLNPPPTKILMSR